MPEALPPPLPRRRLTRNQRYWRRFGAWLLVPILLVAVFYAEEDWRGAHAWTVCRHELQARGESLDVQAFTPPAVPDRSNLALAPLFVRELNYQVDKESGLYTFGPNDKRPADLENIPYGAPRPAYIQTGGWELARPSDLAGSQRYYRQPKSGFPRADQPQSPAADVLLALTRYGPALDELSRAAGERPLCRFPVDWQADNVWKVRLPYY